VCERRQAKVGMQGGQEQTANKRQQQVSSSTDLDADQQKNAQHTGQEAEASVVRHGTVEGMLEGWWKGVMKVLEWCEEAQR
jgi:hypothetical protein